MKDLFWLLIILIIILIPSIYGILTTKQVIINNNCIGVRIDENMKIDSNILTPGTYYINKKDRIVIIPSYDVMYSDSVISITFNNTKMINCKLN